MRYQSQGTYHQPDVDKSDIGILLIRTQYSGETRINRFALIAWTSEMRKACISQVTCAISQGIGLRWAYLSGFGTRHTVGASYQPLYHTRASQTSKLRVTSCPVDQITSELNAEDWLFSHLDWLR